MTEETFSPDKVEKLSALDLILIWHLDQEDDGNRFEECWSIAEGILHNKGMLELK